MNHQPIIICILFGACLGVAISTTPSAAARGKLSQPSAVKSTSATATKLNAGPAGTSAAMVCPTIITDGTVTVAAGQPPVEPRSTVGIVNALCAVTLDIVGCGFAPTSVVLNCDTNGDGVPELPIPLKNVTQVNNLLVRATFVPLTPLLPGTAFPLACCGGSATITLSRTVTAGDDNIFGPFTQSQTCPFELGLRSPVVVSASPGDGDCSIAQDIVIPGSCFILPGGAANVTSVFAVERGNASNIVQATRFVVVNSNLIDALFNPGGTSAGKTYLIFVSGPNGTSRNSSSLPPGAPPDCPLGNEQGIQVSFTCRAGSGAPPIGGTSPAQSFTCTLNRGADGSFSLSVIGSDGATITRGATITVGGLTPKKIKYKNQVAADLFTRVDLKGKFCAGLPGAVEITDPSGHTISFACSSRCD